MVAKTALGLAVAGLVALPAAAGAQVNPYGSSGAGKLYGLARGIAAQNGGEYHSRGAGPI